VSETAARHKAEAPKSLKFALLVCSTSRYRGLKSTGRVEDPSGDLIAETLRRHGHAVVLRGLVSDDGPAIERWVRKALAGEADAVITCGGTGISPTDVTIEAVQPLLEKTIPGFGEALRRLSQEQMGSAAILTRAVAGVARGRAVFCLPGSPQAVSLALERLILPEAPHVVKHAREG